MLSLWRLVKKTHLKHAWDGEGARLFGGRWNLEGTPATYAASTLSLALLEILVGFNQHTLENDFVAFEIQLHKNVKIQTISLDELPKNWQQYPAPYEIQMIGEAYLTSEKPCVLSVPSTVVPMERNYLWHAKFFKEIVAAVSKPLPFPLDARFSIDKLGGSVYKIKL